MKRLAALMATLVVLMALATGCVGAIQGSEPQKADDKKLSVVCTIFPQYDWARQILGSRADDVELTILLDRRIDLHNFQPSVDDIVRISTADLFIYVGGESDNWVEDALEQAVNENMIVINLLQELGDAAKEELPEGMEYDDHGYMEEVGHGGEIEYDEHVWLSLRNAQTYCLIIADALSELDADNAGEYHSNASAYVRELYALDTAYLAAVSAAPVRTLLFADRFPFRYLADDYDISCYAAFPGCSTETEASFETIIFLANIIDEQGLRTVMVTESSDRSIARTVINNTRDKNQQILALDAMQSVAPADIQGGATYISIMEGNLSVLEEALS